MPNRVQINQNYPDIAESNRLYERALGLIPGGSQLLAKGATQYVNGVAPKFLKRGRGSRVWDVDDNEYLDFNMAVGPISLGYGHERVDQAIKDQLEDAINLSLVHPVEIKVAELINHLVPNAEAIRFAKTGADVTSAAVRLARAYTGREYVLCCGYHGWHDWYIGLTARGAGVPQGVKDLVHTFSYNDIDSLVNALDDSVACVIMEPMVFEFPKDDFLAKVKEACEQNGSLLIFDEMWTGFRFALGGAQSYFDVTPDLATFSKAVANGMPLAVLTGRREIMDLLQEQVFFYSTFGDEMLSLAAAKATLQEMIEKEVPTYLARQGQKLQDGYNQIAHDLDLADDTRCIGHPARTLVVFSDKGGDPLLLKSLVQQELIRCGVLWSGFHNICLAHTDEDIAYTLDAYREVLPILKQAITTDYVIELLRGEPVQPVFRKTSDFNIKPKTSVATNGRSSR